ncbi:MAG: TetR/AcrR family transcriptional regulator [Deltaproteobacteria bacterium]|nr:TetR/AcrR family transcriptional regulator [Deltaproteobacteria bacterium]
MRSDAPRAQQKQQTRRHVLASAQRVFAAKGYGATQVRDIVKSAGVSIGTFYHYFDSKEAAFNELVLAGSRTLREAIRNGRHRRGSNLIDQTQASVYTFLRFTREHEDLFRILIRERSRSNSWSLPLGDQLFREAVSDLIADMARSFRGSRLTPKEIELLAWATVSTCVGVVMRKLENREPIDLDTEPALLTRLICGGLIACTRGNLDIPAALKTG